MGEKLEDLSVEQLKCLAYDLSDKIGNIAKDAQSYQNARQADIAVIQSKIDQVNSEIKKR